MIAVGHVLGSVPCRLVGVRRLKEWYWYQTHLPRSALQEQLLDQYRGRWEIESDNKLDKSNLRRDEVFARSGLGGGLVHAAMVRATVVCLIAHHHRLR